MTSYDFAGEAQALIEAIDDTAALACTTPQELELLAVAEIAKAALRRAYEAGQASATDSLEDVLAEARRTRRRVSEVLEERVRRSKP